MRAHALFVTDTDLLLQMHMVSTAFHPDQSPHSTLEVYVLGKTLIYPFSSLQFVHASTDAVNIVVPHSVHHIKDIRSSFCTDKDIALLRSMNFPHLHRGSIRHTYVDGVPHLQTSLESTPYYKMDTISVAIPNSDATIVSPVAIVTRYPGLDGDCGLPYLDLSTHSQRTILGLHSAGSDTSSICSVISYETIMAITAKSRPTIHAQAAIVPIPAGHVPIVPLPPSTLGCLAEPRKVFVSTPVHSSFTTSSTVDAGARKPVKLPSQLRPYTRKGEIEHVPLHNLAERCGRLPLDYTPIADPRALLEFQNFKEWQIPAQTRSVCTEEEVARAQDMSKSLGGYRQDKGHFTKRDFFTFQDGIATGFSPELRSDVDALVHSLRTRGDFGYIPLFSTIIKDEPLDPIKVLGTPGVNPSDSRSRHIVPCPLPLNVLGYMYFHNVFEFIHHNSRHHNGIIGATPSELHARAADIVRMNRAAIAAGYTPTIEDIDLAKCDISTPLPATNFAADYFALVGKRLDMADGLPEEEILANFVIRSSFIRNFGHPTVVTELPFRTPEGVVVTHHVVYESVMLVSGSPQTADANEVTWQLGIFLFCKEFGFPTLADFSQHATMLTYADDALLCTHTDRVKPSEFVAFHNAGILPKAQVGKPALAANGVTSPALLQRIITGSPPRFALREESISSALAYVTKTQNKALATRSNYENALRYYADYGQSFYDKKLLELNRELAQANIAPIMMTWQEAIIH